MQNASVSLTIMHRLVCFGLVPCAIGAGIALYLHWRDVVWLSDAGSFWPITLALLSTAIVVRLCFGLIKDRTSAIAAWLVLVMTWSYTPAWAMSLRVPLSAAVVGRDGGVTVARNATRRPGNMFLLLTDRAAVKIVHNVEGALPVGELKLEYRFAEDYIATRLDDEDLAQRLLRAAAPILETHARGSRATRIALLEDRATQQSVMARICRDAVGDQRPCPLIMKLSPLDDAVAAGATWSKFFTEDEAITERHLPTLLHILMRPDSHVVKRDTVFALVLELAETVEPLVHLARRPTLLLDAQFVELVRRILTAPGCSDEVIALAATVIRLNPEQRKALREKALAEASVAGLLDQAASLRLSDDEIAALGGASSPRSLQTPVWQSKHLASSATDCLV